jgi:hypothetical protein
MTDTELEQLIDKLGLAAVLKTIASICSEKADHIRASYSDEALAYDWDRAAIAVSNCVTRTGVRAVSPEE